MCGFIPQVEFCGKDYATTAGGINYNSNIWKPQETYIPQPQEPKPKENSFGVVCLEEKKSSEKIMFIVLFCSGRDKTKESFCSSDLFTLD